MIDVTTNGDLLIQQDRKGNIRDFVDALLVVIQDELVAPAREMERQASIDTAEGINLDNIGDRFSTPRPGVLRDDLVYFAFDGTDGTGFNQEPFQPQNEDALNPAADPFYRVIIKAVGAALRTDGSVPSMNNVVQQAFGGGRYIDFQDMSMTVIIESSLTPFEISKLRDLGVIPKPAGVRLRTVEVHDGNNFFGFEGTGGTGFDQGPFVTVI